jgi:hypothetical protein
MASNVGCFVSKYQGVVNERPAIEEKASTIAAVQKFFLFQFQGMLC